MKALNHLSLQSFNHSTVPLPVEPAVKKRLAGFGEAEYYTKDYHCLYEGLPAETDEQKYSLVNTYLFDKIIIRYLKECCMRPQ